MSTVDDVIKILNAGFAAYHGTVANTVYERLGCNRPLKARWFCRQGNYICLGCKKRCSLTNPTGFELVLPVQAKATKVLVAEIPAISASQMVKTFRWLRADQAAFCLNISKRRVYYLAEFGTLEQHPDPPFRVSAESVEQEMNRLE